MTDTFLTKTLLEGKSVEKEPVKKSLVNFSLCLQKYLAFLSSNFSVRPQRTHGFSQNVFYGFFSLCLWREKEGERERKIERVCVRVCVPSFNPHQGFVDTHYISCGLR